jgi:hypothetical protein
MELNKGNPLKEIETLVSKMYIRDRSSPCPFSPSPFTNIRARSVHYNPFNIRTKSV